MAGRAVRALDDKKGEQIVVLDLRGLSSVSDYVVLVSGSSPPHLKAMFNEVQQTLKRAGVYCFRRTGDQESGWLVLDYVDVVIHIFGRGTREYYAIEDLWPTAPRTDWSAPHR